MKKIFQIIFIIFFFSNPIQAKNQYLQEGINLFKNKKFRKAQFKFEKDIVFNPKIFDYSFIKTYNLKGIYKAKSGQIYIIKTVKIIIIKKGTTPFATSPS